MVYIVRYSPVLHGHTLGRNGNVLNGNTDPRQGNAWRSTARQGWAKCPESPKINQPSRETVLPILSLPPETIVTMIHLVICWDSAQHAPPKQRDAVGIPRMVGEGTGNFRLGLGWERAMKRGGGCRGRVGWYTLDVGGLSGVEAGEIDLT